MVQLIALVKPFRARAVLAALETSGVAIFGATVREVRGYGRQKNRLHRYLGSEYDASFLPKLELTLFLDAAEAPTAVKAIVGAARTGRMGDGKVFLLPCLDESPG